MVRREGSDWDRACRTVGAGAREDAISRMRRARARQRERRARAKTRTKAQGGGSVGGW